MGLEISSDTFRTAYTAHFEKLSDVDISDHDEHSLDDDDLELENNDDDDSLGQAGFLSNDESDNGDSESADQENHVSMSIFADEDTTVGTGMVGLTGFSLVVAFCVAML